jgi:transcriptional regulator with XRE-family HTH domain
MAKRPQPVVSIGDRLRLQRVEKLNKGLREMARFLDIAPAHLTDIENGRRNPSEDLLVRIAAAYQMPVPDLRSAFSKPESIVEEIASDSPTEAEKVPMLLRSTRGMTPAQYDELIRQAKKITGKKGSAEK